MKRISPLQTSCALISLLLLFNGSGSSPLRLKKDGTFKVMLLTDLHFASDSDNTSTCRPKTSFPNYRPSITFFAHLFCGNSLLLIQVYPILSVSSHVITSNKELPSPVPFLSSLSRTLSENIAQIRQLLHHENPDFVVFGGDQISDYDSGAPKPKPLEWAMRRWTLALSPMFENRRRLIPYATILGNHDYGVQGSADDLLKFDAGHPGSLTKPSNDTGYVLEVVDSDGVRPLVRLYMFNSGPAGFQLRHVDWYRSTSNRFGSRRKGASPSSSSTSAPALAFIHIPMQEFLHAYNAGAFRGQMSDRDGICCQETQTDMFDVFVEHNEVKVISSGHDHGNNFVAEWQGIKLAYGLKTGYGGYGIGTQTGARMFLISSVDVDGDGVVGGGQNTNMNGKNHNFGTVMYSESVPSEKRDGRNRTTTIRSWLRFVDGSVDHQDTVIQERPALQLQECCVAPPKQVRWSFLITTTLAAIGTLLGLFLIAKAFLAFRRSAPSSSTAHMREA